MEWRDTAILLSTRPHGESGAVAQFLTRAHGRHAGYIPGGGGKTKRATLQAGAEGEVLWKARLSDQLGNAGFEVQRQHAAAIMEDADRLAALSAAVAMCEQVLPEREAYPECFDGLKALFEHLPQDFWAALYVRWELSLLAALGFGLHLDRCAVTGEMGKDLIYVSPRSARAVSRAAGEAYKERLLALPGFLTGQGALTPETVLQGLDLTGHFFNKYVFHPHDKSLPLARLRLYGRLHKKREVLAKETET